MCETKLLHTFDSHLYLYMFLYFLLTAYFVVGMWVPNMSNILITPVLFSPE